jgi:hypothetical protein
VNKIIVMTFSSIEFLNLGHTLTRFKDGTEYGSHPHYTDEYHMLAKRLGYPSVESYCQEHEFCHNFIPEEVFGEPSRVLWPLAHGGKHGSKKDILAEEALCILFQGFLRNNQTMAATAPGVNWWALRDKAYQLLGDFQR